MTYYRMVHPVARGLVLLPLLLLNNQCSNDDDGTEQGNSVAGASGAHASTIHGAGMGGNATGGNGAATAIGGNAAGGSSFGATGGYAGRGEGGSYCRETREPSGTEVFHCPSDYCGALAQGIQISDGKSGIFEGSAVQAGHCAAPSDLDSVYFGFGVGVKECFYRAGAFVGWVYWGDVGGGGCYSADTPTIYGEVPESVIVRYPATCGELTNYRPLKAWSSGGAAGAAGAVEHGAGNTWGGAAGSAGAAGAPVLGSCFRAATATCEPC